MLNTSLRVLGVKNLMFYLSNMRFIAVLYLITLPLLGLGQAKRAQNLLEKDKIDNAIELLRKTIAKDSLAPAAKYLLADYLFEPDSSYYDLDSAYFYILAAQADFSGLPEKDQEKLIDDSFSPEFFNTLKSEIELAAFERAKNLNRVRDYTAFMNDFESSSLIDSAIYYRNKKAFFNASQTDTYQAYKSFLETYPTAVDARVAEKRYEYLLFEEKTSSGKLSDYQSFLKNYPETWHRKEVEHSIFNIITGRNSTEAYKTFINQYPKSYLREMAALRMYQSLSNTEKSNFLTQDFVNAQVRDSLEQVATLQNELLILTHQDNQTQIIDSKGEVVLTTSSEVSNPTKCAESLHYIQLESKKESTLLCINGSTIIQDNFKSYSVLPSGFLELNYENGKSFIHPNGDPTSGKIYQNARFVGPYIGYKFNDRWGLESITGITMTQPEFDTLYQFNNHLILSKEGQYGIYSFSDLHPLLDQNIIDYSYPYSSVSVLSSDRILVKKDGLSALLNGNLKELVPFANQAIELLENGYFIDAFDSILDSRVAKKWYLDISSNNNWTLGFKADSVDIYYKKKLFMAAERAELIGTTAVSLTKEDITSCYFSDSSSIVLEEGDIIRPIRKMGQSSSSRHYILTQANKKQSVVNMDGEPVELPKFDKLRDLGDDYMIFAIKSLVYNILDNQGKTVLKNVDGATSLGRGYISFLSDGKFGLFNTLNNTFVKAKYDKPIKAYDENYFIVESNGLQGLVDRADSVVVPIRYSEIRYYNDSIAILNNNFRWTFWNLKNGSILLDNVSDYWNLDYSNQSLVKIFKGVGYGIWSPSSGVILNSTFGEVTLKHHEKVAVLIAEKWVEEADLVVLLYYGIAGELLKKSVLSTAQFEALKCNNG
jgi:hypothetical protein